MINNKALCEVQGGGEITLYKDNTRHIKHWCNMGRSTAQSQYVQFLAYSGWKNPHQRTEECCWKNSSTTPPIGRTYFWPIGNTVRIITNIGTANGGDEYLTSSVTKE